MRRCAIPLLAVALQIVSCQNDGWVPFSKGDGHHVGSAAQELRDTYLSNREHIVARRYDPEKGLQSYQYGHMPQISFEPPAEDGSEELVNIRVIAHNVEDNAHNATIWIEHHEGDVVCLCENTAHCQCDIHEDVKVPGTRLIPYNLDDRGLWVGQAVVAGHPLSPAEPKEEL